LIAPALSQSRLAISDCVGSCFPEFHEMGLRMILAQGSIFGWVAPSPNIISALLSEAT
jgi:biuret amidohydrolase